MARGRRSGRSGRSAALASASRPRRSAADGRGAAISPAPASSSTRSATPVVRIVAHSASTKCARTSRSWTSPDWLRTWPEQALGLEAERREHGDRRSCPATTSTTSLVTPSSTASTTARWASRRPSPRRRCVGGDDEPQLADVACSTPTPWRPRRSRRPRRRRSPPAGAGRGRRATLDDAGLEDVLLEERAVALGHAAKNAASASASAAVMRRTSTSVPRGRVPRPSRAAPSGVPASRPSPGGCGGGRSGRRSADVAGGQAQLLDVGGADEVVSTSTASGVTMWSFSPRTLRNGTVMSARSMVRPPRGTVPVGSRFCGRGARPSAERRARERDVVVRPLRHRLVGGDEVVVPEVLPQVDVAGDVAGGVEHLERVAHDVGGDVAGRVEQVAPARPGRPGASTSSAPSSGKSTGVAITARLRTGRSRVAGQREQRQHAAEAVAEHVTSSAAGDVGDLAHDRGR